VPASTLFGVSSLSRLAGQFGGIAAFAGINLGASGGKANTEPAMELVKSWGF